MLTRRQATVQSQGVHVYCKAEAVSQVRGDSQLKFTESESLGEGSFGKCKLAIYNKHKVCVKALRRDVIDEAHLLREGRLLSMLHHQHIPHCFGVCRVMLVMSLNTVKGKPLVGLRCHNERLWSSNGEQKWNKVSVPDSYCSHIHAWERLCA